MRSAKWFAAVLAAVACGAATDRADAVVVTLSGLNNGVNTATDPNNTSTGQAIPVNYQPLLNAYPAPGGGVDGGNIGVTITYANSFVAAKATNATVNDHTQMATPSDNAQVNLYDNGANPITLTFSDAVTMPSFFYTFFATGTYSGTFSAFTNAADTTPVASFTFGPTSIGSYVWQEETRFGTTPMRKVTFSRSSQFLQLDDFTINPVPEPGALGLLGTAGLGLFARRRRRRRDA